MNKSDKSKKLGRVARGLDDVDRIEAIQRYNERYAEFGYSPKTLGWWGGKQDVRFDILTSQFSLEGMSILDIGCGFGDLNRVLREKCRRYRYAGIDLNPNLIAKAKELYSKPSVSFWEGEFLEMDLPSTFDYAIESGIFNHKYVRGNNYEVIRDCMAKCMSICREGLAFDFNSDRRPDQKESIFYSNPGKIMEIAFEFSNNVVLRHDYMPFEFAVFVFKDSSFANEEKLFSRYKKLTGFCWKPVA